MTVLEKIKREREEARERLRIDDAYNRYDAHDLSEYTAGTVVRFDVELGDGKFLTYAAVLLHKDGARWWVTGRNGPNGAPTEDFVAWLIERHVDVDDLVFMIEEGATDE